MRLCIPTATGEGMAAQVYGHFGSAPFFTVYDYETSEVAISDNGQQKHVHGTCQPMAMIANLNVDAVVCGGIGMRALQRLNEGGIKVYIAQGSTVAQIVEAFKNGGLPEMGIDNTCGAHGHGHGCSH